MAETKRDDQIRAENDLNAAALAQTLTETAEKLFRATQVRGPLEHADLMKEASDLMTRAASMIERFRTQALAVGSEDQP